MGRLAPVLAPAALHRLRRNRQTSARLPAHRRFLRAGRRSDHPFRRLSRPLLERGRRPREQPVAIGGHRPVPPRGGGAPPRKPSVRSGAPPPGPPPPPPPRKVANPAQNSAPPISASTSP